MVVKLQDYNPVNTMICMVFLKLKVIVGYVSVRC